jgi:hypothetical protein
MPANDKKSKKPKLSKKEKKALQQAKEEEQRRKEQELEDMRRKVQKMLEYKVPPAAMDIVVKRLPCLQANPWVLVHDIEFANTLLSGLCQVMQYELGVDRNAKNGIPVAANGMASQLLQNQNGTKDESKAESGNHDQMKWIVDTLVQVGEFAVHQPAFFFEDEKVLAKLVSLLEILQPHSIAFKAAIDILTPTVNNPELVQAVKHCGVISTIIQCANSKKMVALTSRRRATNRNTNKKSGNDSGDTADNANDDDVDAIDEEDEEATEMDAAAEAEAKVQQEALEAAQKQLQEQADNDLVALKSLFGMVRNLSAHKSLRDLFKADTNTYLRLRRIADGEEHVDPGMEKVARESMHYFIQDTVRERAQTAVCDPYDVNAAMLTYWRGHIHALFCDTSTKGPSNSTGSGGTGSKGGLSSMTRSHKQRFKPGFANDQTLEAINRRRKRVQIS